MASQATTSINNDIYDQLGDRWYTAHDDPVALLRAESKLKTPWIRDRLPLGARVLDVGCGAGFLSNSLASTGSAVTGLDLSTDSLRVAREHDATRSVEYIAGDAYRLPFEDASFDAVTAMDFLEHIDRPAEFIREVSRVLRPGGRFFFHTFNRNHLAHLVIIKLVEWLVANTPRHMHVIDLFLKPSEVAAMCSDAQMSVNEMTGIKPIFSTITLRDLVNRRVPENFAFEFTSSLKLSYLGFATKELDR